jgi:branched-chain amino acid transport system ATP-binding protein
MTPLLEIDGLRAGYGNSEILHGLSLEIEQGEAVGVLGPNGAGKTTLLRTLSGVLRATGGSIKFRGQEVRGASATDIVKQGLIHVPEGRHVFRGMSVRDNLRLGAHAVPKGSEDRLASVVDLFPVLGQRIRQSAETLSGGEQQMLAIGRALMADPALLLLDEPTLGLAPVVVEEVVSRLQDAKLGFNTSLLLVEQRVYIARELCSRQCVLANGRIVREMGEGADTDVELLNEYMGAGVLSASGVDQDNVNA